MEKGPVKPTEVIAPASKPVMAFMVETMRLDDPKQIRKRAELFHEAWPKTSSAMIARAEMLEAEAPFVKSPFYRVSDYRWTKFVRSITEEPKENSSLLGVFLFSIRRLAELGLVKNPKKGEDNKWRGEWIAPMTEEKFLKSAKVQYGIFVASMRKFIPVVCKDYGKFVGQKIAGKKVTLSGLLALVHRAGVKGAAGWLSDPEQRKKFPHTTETFLKATGAF